MQDSSAAQRVKVYRLNDEGLWDDKGTGHISVEYLEQSDSVGLVVVAEEDARPLLIHRINTKEDIYQRQSGDDTIITWRDPEVVTDIALSFAEVVGCNFIWEQIQRVQDSSARQPDSPGRQRMVDEFDANIDDFPEVGPARPLELPPADLQNLPELAKLLNEVSFLQREALAMQVVREGYVRKVLDLFRQCEDLEDQPSLVQLYGVVRGLVLLGETQLLEALLEEGNVMDVVGALEYEPGLSSPPRHREFLKQQVVFKEVVPIQDPAVRQRIHASYHMGYIKDVVLPRVLDDQTFAALSSLMLFYNHDVLMALQSDTQFFPELFRRLRSAPSDSPEWADLVRFMQELCSQAKHLQPGNRQLLLTRLISLGLFEVISKVVEAGDEPLQYKAADVLLSSVLHDPAALRAYVLEPGGQPLFARLIALLVTSRDAGLQEQILEVLRTLLDPDTMDQTPEKDAFLELFYDKHMAALVGALQGHVPTPAPSSAASPSPQQQHIGPAAAPAGSSEAAAAAAAGPALQPAASGQQPQQQQQQAGQLPAPGGPQPQQQQQHLQQQSVPQQEPGRAAAAGHGAGSGRVGGGGLPAITARTLGLIIELLCFCVQHHGYRIKYYTLRNNVVEKVLKLLRRRERWLVVAAIRFLRTCISLKDDFYNRYITRNSLFEPVFAVFFANGERYNLLNSAVLELIDFIRRENLKNLVTHIVENYYSRLQEVEYVDTFRQLKHKYDQNMERERSGAAGMGVGGGGIGPGGGPGLGGGPGVGPQIGPELPRGMGDGSGQQPGVVVVVGGGMGGGPGAEPRRGPGVGRGLDRDEEDYFNEGDDDEEGPATAQGQDDAAPGTATCGDAGGGGGLPPLIGNGAPLPGPPLSLLPRLVDYDDDDAEEETSFAGSKHPPSEQPPSPGVVAKRPRTDEGGDGSSPPPPQQPQQQQQPGGKVTMSIKSSGSIWRRTARS